MQTKTEKTAEGGISRRIVSPPLADLDQLRPPLTPGERRLLDVLLAGLPAGWEIYMQPHLNGMKPDFVLLNPDVGIGVFEVKDWDLGAMPFRWERGLNRNGHLLMRQNRDGKWFRSENPLEKILFYKWQLLDLYAPSLRKKGSQGKEGAAVTAGIVFANASRADVQKFLGDILPDTEQGRFPQYNPIISRDDLEAGVMGQIFPESSRARSVFMNADAARDLRAWLVEPEHIRSQRQPLPLDARQREIVESRTATGYRRIRGPAGSGKTHVLAAKAARLASEGRRVLLVSYNITLINYIRDLIVRAGLPKTGLLNFVDRYNFHEWCKWICNEHGYGDEYKSLWSDGNSGDAVLRGDRLPALAKRVVEEARARGETKGVAYDAVLVDEGQDFELSWWQAVTSTVDNDSDRLLVADMTQDVYETAEAWTDEAMSGAGFRGPWTELKTAYRLPPQLVPYVRDFAERYLPSETLNLPEAQQLELGTDVKLRWIQVGPEDDFVTVAAQAVVGMPVVTDPEPVAFSDVVLVVDQRWTGLRIVDELEARGIRVEHTFDIRNHEGRAAKRKFFMGRERVKGTTIHSFKGWEARYLVVCVSQANRQKDLAALYVALTRLKATEFGGSYLTVVCSEPRLAEYGATWPKDITDRRPMQ